MVSIIEDRIDCSTCNRVFLLKDLFVYCPYCLKRYKGRQIKKLIKNGCKRCYKKILAFSCPNLDCGAKHNYTGYLSFTTPDDVIYKEAYYKEMESKVPPRDDSVLIYVFYEKKYSPYLKGVPTITYEDYGLSFNRSVINFHNVGYGDYVLNKAKYVPFNKRIPNTGYETTEKYSPNCIISVETYDPKDEIEHYDSKKEIEQVEPKKPKYNKSNMLIDILSIIFKKDILNYQIEVQELENKLTNLEYEPMKLLVKTINDYIDMKDDNAKAELKVSRVDLLKKCTANVDKLKARDLRYILTSFANPNMINPQTDKEINEDLDQQIVNEKKEDNKSKKYDNLMKKDKYNQIKKKRLEDEENEV